MMYKFTDKELKILLKNAMAFVDKKFAKCDISIENNLIKNISTFEKT